MIEERYNKLAWQLEKISGYDITLNTVTRKYPYPLLRAMVYKQLRDEGFSSTAIGKVAGKDHATVLQVIQTLVGVIDYPTQKDMPIIQIYNSFIDQCTDKVNIELTQMEFKALQNILNRICVKVTN